MMRLVVAPRAETSRTRRSCVGAQGQAELLGPVGLQWLISSATTSGTLRM